MRIRQLEQVQQRFAVQQQRVVEINRMLTETRQQIRDELTPRPEETVDPILAQQRFRYVQFLKQQAEHLGKALMKEEQILNRIREEMRQAHVRKKSLELLEEKQRAAYIRNIENQEMKELEDIVIGRRHGA